MSHCKCPIKSTHRIIDDANQLLIKLSECHILLKQLNQEIESRPFSTRIHGQFDHELKKSQQLIHKLSALLRSYHSFELSSSSVSLQHSHSDNNHKPIDESFIVAFKDLCIDIEREWRIGTKRINKFYATANIQTNSRSESGYHSDTNTRSYHRQQPHHRNHPRSRSRSPSPMHSFSFSNPINTNPKFTKFERRKQCRRDDHTQLLESKIDDELVPCYKEEVLSQQIRDIADDLQYLLQINAQVQQLVLEQDEHITSVKQKVESAKENVASGGYNLSSVPHSYLVYGVMGGVTMAMIGAPIALVSAGIKAAVGGAIGFGTIGVFGGTLYAKKANENMDNDNASGDDEAKEKLIASESSTEEEHKSQQTVKPLNVSSVSSGAQGRGGHGFQTKPRKRTNVYHYLNDNNCNDNDDANMEDWDARM